MVKQIHLIFVIWAIIYWCIASAAENDPCRVTKFPRNGWIEYAAEPNNKLLPGELVKALTSVNYKCHENYLIDGSTTNNCSGGQWMSPVPDCKSMFSNDAETRCGELAPKGTPYIVGGFETNIINVPWHVGVYKFNEDTASYGLQCGGSIVSARVVISAMHCFWDRSAWKPYNVSLFRIAAAIFPEVEDNKQLILKIEIEDMQIQVGDSVIAESGNRSTVDDDSAPDFEEFGSMRKADEEFEEIPLQSQGSLSHGHRYETMVGRVGSTIYFCYGDLHMYTKDRETKGILYLKCRDRAHCRARAYIDLSTNQFTITKSFHTDPIQQNAMEVVKFRNAVTARIRSSSEHSTKKKSTFVRAIWEDELLKHPNIVKQFFLYKTMERTFLRLRAATLQQSLEIRAQTEPALDNEIF